MPKYRLSEFWLEMNETETLKDFSADKPARTVDPKTGKLSRRL